MKKDKAKLQNKKFKQKNIMDMQTKQWLEELHQEEEVVLLQEVLCQLLKHLVEEVLVELQVDQLMGAQLLAAL